MLGTSRFLPTASRRGLVVGGLLVSSIALSLVFINMPDEAPLRITTNDAIIGKPQFVSCIHNLIVIIISLQSVDFVAVRPVVGSV